jgi:hypothetical protein
MKTQCLETPNGIALIGSNFPENGVHFTHVQHSTRTVSGTDF